MPASPSPFSTARLLADEAHALRNHVATLRAAGLLLDDAEVAADVATAASALQLVVERAVTAARVELDERPARVQVQLGELVRHAERRAAREGRAQRDPDLLGASSDLVVDGPGSWMERLLTDLLHVAVGPLSVADSELRCRVDPARWAPLDGYLQLLAAACDCTVRLEGELAVLQLPDA